MPIPRSLRVLSTPREVFVQAAQAQSGLGTLLGWLAVECVLLYPGSVLAALFRIRAAPMAALQTLWGMVVRYSIGPMFTMLAGAVVLHLLTRRRGVQYDIWPVAGSLAYSWFPHTLCVALGTALTGFNLTVPLPLPVRQVLLFGPTAALAVVAIRALNTSPPAPVQPPKRQTPLAALAAALIALGALGSGWDLHQHWNDVKPINVGDRFPAVVLRGVNHPNADMALLPGQVTLVDFWATWCPPCVASMPHLQHLHETLGPHGFEVFAVNIESDNQVFVRQFLKDQNLTMPVFVDTDGSLQARLHVSVYPTSFLVDATGVVQALYYGPADPAELETKIRGLLSGN